MYCQVVGYASATIDRNVLDMELVTVDHQSGDAKNWRMTREERRRAGRKLKAKRVERGLKQIEVAEDPKLGISVGTLQAIENAWYQVRDTSFEKYARYFGTTITKLLTEDQPKLVGPHDPLLADLNEEHLDVARQYMRARKRVRTAIETLFAHPDEEHLTAILALAATFPTDTLIRLRRVLEAERDGAAILATVEAELKARAEPQPTPRKKG